MSRAKNPKYESMSLEELKANMEKSKTGTGGSNSPQKHSGAAEEAGRTQGTFPPADCQRGRV